MIFDEEDGKIQSNVYENLKPAQIDGFAHPKVQSMKDLHNKEPNEG